MRASVSIPMNTPTSKMVHVIKLLKRSLFSIAWACSVTTFSRSSNSVAGTWG
jgi:hypothetical protein